MLDRLLFRKHLKWYFEAPKAQRARLDFVARSLLDRDYLPVVVADYAREWVRFLRITSRWGLPMPTSIHAPEVRRYLRWRFPSASGSRFRGIRVAIRILIDMDERGGFPARMRAPARNRTLLVRALVPSYLAFVAAHRGVVLRTLHKHERQLARFAEFLRRRRVTEWTRVDAMRIREFLTRLEGLQPQTRCSYAYTLRSFFRWAFLRGALSVDLSRGIPTVRHYRLARLPNLLTTREIQLLLGSADRSSSVGRRDYAILLLAARYGMRPSDIRQLSLDHVDWVHRRIVFEQSKTRRELALPLLRDVGVALREYIRRGRPRTDVRNIFVRHKAPFEPFCPENNFNQVMRGALFRAGLANRKGGRGLYLFRHTLATHLLSAGRPLKTVGDILGHATSQSTLIYTKVDLPTLRSVVISMREVLA